MIDEIKELQKHNRTNIGVEIEAATLLASLFYDSEQFEKCANLLKLSNHEKSLGKFIIVFKSQGPFDLKKYQTLLVDNYTSKGFEIYQKRVLQLVLYEGSVKYYLDLCKWIIPLFPVNGNQLKDFGIVGKQIGIQLKKLKKIWIDSNFSLSDSELLKEL